MQVRRVLTSMAIAVLVAGGASIAAAPSASAETTYAIDGCQSGSFSISPSEVVVVAFPDATCPTPASYSRSNSLLTGSTFLNGYFCLFFSAQDLNLPASMVVTGGGGLEVTYTPRSEPASTISSAVLTDECGGSSFSRPAAGAGSGQDGPSWVQSYGRAASDVMCRDGWDPSYAAWMNDGQGGWVCNRALTYNQAQRLWQVTYTVTP